MNIKLSLIHPANIMVKIWEFWFGEIEVVFCFESVKAFKM